MIVVTDKNIVYVAADSLQSYTETKETLHHCKIRRLGSSYWAAASEFYESNATGFNLEKFVDSLGTEGTIHSKMDRFIGAIDKPMKRELGLMALHDRDLYARLLKSSRPPLEIAFVESKDGVTEVDVVRFFVASLSNDWRAERTRVSTADQIFGVTGTGSYTVAGAYLEKHIPELNEDPSKVLRESMQNAANVDPEGSGPPFSIIRLDATGAQWLVGGACKCETDLVRKTF